MKKREASGRETTPAPQAAEQKLCAFAYCDRITEYILCEEHANEMRKLVMDNKLKAPRSPGESVH